MSGQTDSQCVPNFEKWLRFEVVIEQNKISNSLDKYCTKIYFYWFYRLLRWDFVNNSLIFDSLLAVTLWSETQSYFFRALNLYPIIR